MSTLSRSNTKRRRDDVAEEVPHAASSPSKRHQRRPSSVAQDQNPYTDVKAPPDFQESKALLARLFQALETALLASLSPSPSFHGLQDAVAYTARSQFNLSHLAQIAGVQPDAFTFEPVMVLHKGNLIPSLSVTPQGMENGRHVGSSARLAHFKECLARWQGQSAQLPELVVQSRTPALSEGKRSLLQKPAQSAIRMEEPGTLLRGTAQARESALLDRILAKKRARLEEGVQTPEDLTQATVLALVPATMMSIKMLLASKPKAAAKSLGMRELVDNLKTSLRSRTGEAEILQIIQQIAKQYPGWCKIGQVGQIQIVRFIGEAPRL
ncbi:hypothetical protein BCR37DRAFT_391930 [Protomyces lactucae-debilis]|uniref:DNA replication factor Cdt1 C-terminal domain-containing protein n=1 Tax=Protomyces lactucae-debilis TaxID=2754530 RepID=A0A1Y2FK40_PROLT|nr:uncharacterized protein BCR37DRAFT_391930 [Protomyces lactucae-debilis]ORY84342.1 hypothetical protein BCR37DRAFT_391930 [Protomyces lactucae-debilis]